MVTLSLYQSLPSLIESIGQEHFYDQVAHSIQTLDAIDEIKIVSYSKADKPVLLGECPMSKLDKIYCESAYLLDPVYDLVCQKNHKEMVTLDSLVTQEFYQSAYYDSFYQQLGWQNETNIVIGTQDGRSICIAYSTNDNHRAQKMAYDELTLTLNPIKTAIQTHERIRSSNVTDKKLTLSKPQPDSNLSNLTKREKEIVGFILDGLSSSKIASKCFVSEGTVKNHRKNIYRKLGIKSQAELFHHFIA
ncbi:helix-turn-helix domain-containing protein [Marinomonas spartinae]|uniref:helix-turn-helix domain-containing protein n=1 Tax=Marinomonas spartinae TaxID=1792290 RepID=UPI0018F1B674|nr:helix-turn-helix transcriptional regulator [Marinomonas spartinae]MBJ7556943.1 hypothetical protein [Marinomonas spartinae]